MYTSFSLYSAFPSTLLSKGGLLLPVSLFLRNRGGLVNDSETFPYICACQLHTPVSCVTTDSHQKKNTATTGGMTQIEFFRFFFFFFYKKMCFGCCLFLQTWIISEFDSRPAP